MASLGNLDDLLNTVYNQYSGISTQSEVYTAPSPATTLGGTVSSVTVTTTGQSAFPTLAGVFQYKITAVSNANDTISVTTLNSVIGDTETWNVIGFNSTGILVSGVNEDYLAADYAQGGASIAHEQMAILSPNPVPAGLTETFTKTGFTTGTPTPAPTPTIPVTPAPVTPVVPTGLTVTDTVTHLGSTAQPTAYSGPVAGLTSEFISPTADSLNIACTTPGWFIKGGAGNDAIACSSGTNVIDGGTGSNFLTGGNGTDTFFVDDRSASADIWSTVVGFHAGDAATIWGVTPQDFNLTWLDGQGAPGYTGLTLHATSAGKPTASLTLAGFSQADMANGRLSVSFGAVDGSAYMYVHGNS